MERKTDQWTISLPPALSKEAMQLAKKESFTRSELVRTALRSYLEKRRDLDEVRRNIGRDLRRRGIRTMADIEKMIDEGRT